MCFNNTVKITSYKEILNFFNNETFIINSDQIYLYIIFDHKVEKFELRITDRAE